MRKLLLPALVLALLCACDDMRDLAKDVRLADLRDKIESGNAKAKEGLSKAEWREGEREFAEAIADPRFAQLPREERAWAWAERGVIASNLGDRRKGRSYTLQALRLKPVWPLAWKHLSYDQHLLHEDENAAISTAIAIRQDPRIDTRLEDWVMVVLDETPLGSRGARRLLGQLTPENWNSLRSDAGEVWRRLALEKLESGDRDSAKQVLERIRTPNTLIRVRVDKRFDGLYEPASIAPRLRELSESRMKYLREQVAARPRELLPRLQLARELATAGRFADIVRETDEVWARVDSSREENLDDEYRLFFIRDQRATALEWLGRKDESMHSFEEASRLDGYYQWEAMQSLADEYCSARSAQQLRRALALTAKMSHFEDGPTFHYLQHCLAVLEGDVGTEQRELQYLQQHRDERWVAYVFALKRSGRMDEAAAEIISRLESEADRVDALLLLQVWKIAPNNDSPGEALVHANLALRDDVKTAVEKVGRIESFDFYGY